MPSPSQPIGQGPKRFSFSSFLFLWIETPQLYRSTTRRVRILLRWITMLGQPRLLSTLAFFLLVLSGQRLSAPGVALSGGVCKPASMRDKQVGCWILADEPIGTLTKSPVFWTLDAYPTRAAAEADRGPRDTVLESLGKVWLLNIEYEKSKPSHGTRTAELARFPSSRAKTIPCNTWRRSSTTA